MKREHRELLARLAPGTIVAVDVGVWHEGIVSDRRDPESGLPWVISCSRRLGRAAEEPWSVFAPAGCPIGVVGYPSGLRPRTVLARARAGIGREWTPTRNCEAFARGCHGFEGSPSVEGIASIVAAGLRAVSILVL